MPAAHASHTARAQCNLSDPHSFRWGAPSASAIPVRASSALSGCWCSGGALLFPQGPEREKEKLKQNPAGPFFNTTSTTSDSWKRMTERESHLQWYAAPCQSQAKVRSESSVVPEFFPPLVLVPVGLRRVSPHSQDLKPSYPIFAWGLNCHFSNQIDLLNHDQLNSPTLPIVYSALANSQHNCRSLQETFGVIQYRERSRRGLDHSRTRLIRSSRII
jgi:hypothetical protein